MEYIVFIGVIAAIIIAVTVKGYFNHKTNIKNFKLKLKKGYGSYPQKEYKPEQYANIAKYYLKHTMGFQIDDITWNDLEMDRLFIMMNHTYSSAGEEYLYYTLRTPKMKPEELEQMNVLVEYFMKHEAERIQMQLMFAALGKTGKFSLYDYIDYLGNLGKRSNTKQYIVNAFYILALVIIPFTSIGIVMLIALVCYNIGTYFSEKSDIDPYITSFSYIMRLLRSVETLKAIKIPEIDSFKDKLMENRKQFHNFTKNAKIVMAESATGNPLDFIWDYIKMVFHLDIIKFNSMLSELKQKTGIVDEMVQAFGYLESTIAIGAFRASLPNYCIPVLHQGKELRTEEIYHPYITDAISNSIIVERGVLLTGSNASGKSTFLKTIALNSIMAQTVYTATALHFETSFFRLYSSMSLRDDLEGGESYYMVEIRSLKRILDAAREPLSEPVLCFVDEVLRGTNTVERIAASTQILKSLARPEVLCFAATHDIELTKLLEKEYDNYHFTEDVVAGDVLFSYKLLEGSATTRNAIKLLGMIGYQEDIIAAATKMAGEFADTGQWRD